MNLLIVGGLLGVALLAILGVVLLSIGEHGDRRKAAAQAQVAPAVQVAPVAQVSIPTAALDTRASLPQTTTIPLPPLEEFDGNGHVALGEVEPLMETSRQLSYQLERDTHAAAIQSGQLYELVEELHELRQQAGQIESRLGLLQEMLNHMQHEHYQEAVALGE